MLGDQEGSVPLEKLQRTVYVFDLEVVSFDGKVIKFVCKVSKGTYIRVLAQKFVEQLGTAGHVQTLCRTESSFLKLTDCIELPKLLHHLETGGSIDSYLVPTSRVSLNLPRISVLLESDQERLMHGQKLVLKKGEDVKGSFLFLKEELNFSNSKEFLLQDEKGFLFAIGDVIRAGANFYLKVKKGLL